ncbi:MAG: sulfatase-like hydrolase/transferase, partial [Firmicutes bacterium]|nr:sulfatase-like hydrolase/transferase [Bacillota bacterium]
HRDYWMAADVLEFTSDGYGGHMFDAEGRRREFTGYRADRQTDFALEYLRNRKRDKPFFLFVSYLEPHHQNNAGHFQGPPGSKERYRRYPVPEDLKRLGGGDWEREYPDYLGCCASLDYNVGRIVQALKEQGLYENTVIAYTSDHGSHFRTRNSEYKRSCHESSIRVPLILRGPGFTGGQVMGELASLIDLPATLLRCGGAEIPPGMQGNPLQELVAGNADAWPQEVFLQISESQVGRALRTERWKYSVKAPGKSGWLHAGAKVYREEFLYDLKHDPHELNNLVGHADYAQVRARLRQRLIERMEAAGEKAPRILDGRWRPCPR